jgi:haloalkane dehalogenase
VPAAYRTPDSRFEALSGWDYVPRYLDQDGLRMHYVEEGAGDPVLLLHGEPTWGFLYRRLVPPLLAAGHRVVLPDLFGFGRSDKPVDQGWYSYERHYRSIERLAEEVELRGLTVVVHDWGGPIGLRLAVEHPERVERLVVTNTGVDAGRAPSETWLRFREVVRQVGGELEVARLVAAGCARPVADEALAAYDAPFPAPDAKAGVLAFPELVPTEPDHPTTAALLRVREALRAWTKPALVVFGDSDPIFSHRAAERMAELIPGAGPAELLANAAHFLQEDAGEALGERIAEWLASG